MQKVSVDHLEKVVKMHGNLRLRDTRQLFSILRQYSPDGKDDIVLSSGFLPKFGVTTGEIGFAYIINAPSRNSNK
jgi:hypothetical protein